MSVCVCVCLSTFGDMYNASYSCSAFDYLFLSIILILDATLVGFSFETCALLCVFRSDYNTVDRCVQCIEGCVSCSVGLDEI